MGPAHVHRHRHQRVGHRTASAPSAAVIPANTPGAPTNVTATNHANSQSTVSWTAPASNGGSVITGYTVTSSGGQTLHHHAGTTSCTVTGLTNGTAYTFTVTATNIAGTGASSAPSASITPATVPGAPTGVSAGSNVDSQSPVTWTIPASNGGLPSPLYGDLQPRWADLHQRLDQLLGDRADQRHELHLHGDRHQCRRHRTGLGPLQPGHSGSHPGRPTGVTATSFANGQSTVSWTAPASNGSPITSYTVTANTGQTCTTANGSTTTCVFLGLTNGVTYTFTVTATNNLGVGPPSAPATATPSTTPGAPTGVTATSFANTQSSWRGPHRPPMVGRPSPATR